MRHDYVAGLEGISIFSIRRDVPPLDKDDTGELLGQLRGC